MRRSAHLCTVPLCWGVRMHMMTRGVPLTCCACLLLLLPCVFIAIIASHPDVLVDGLRAVPLPQPSCTVMSPMLSSSSA